MNNSTLGSLLLFAAHSVSGCVSTAEAQARPDAGAPQSARCVTDNDCGWNDDCMPTACVPGGSRQRTACDESSPRPGECTCRAGSCTLRRANLASTRSATSGCRSSADCALDVRTGICRVQRGNTAPNALIDDRFCDCDAASSTCVERAVAPVSCRTWRDCSWARAPLRAVSSREVRRPVARPVRACRDGEVDSVCVSGQCRIVAWGC